MKHRNIKVIEGKIPVLVSAPHTRTILITKKGSTYIKPKEIGVAQITRSVCQNTGSWGIHLGGGRLARHWNQELEEPYKLQLEKIIKERDIKIFIDIHGAKRHRPFLLDYDLFTTEEAHPHDNIIEKLIYKNFQEHIDPSKINNGFFRKINGPGNSTLTYHVRVVHKLPAVQLELNERLRGGQTRQVQTTIKTIVGFIDDYMKHVT